MTSIAGSGTVEEERAPRSVARAIAVAVLVGLVVGVLTSVGQRLLPEIVAPLANSAGPWVVVAHLVCRGQRRAGPAMACASLALVGMVAGYGVFSALRGFSWSREAVMLWTMAAVVVGPALGIGATWRHANPAWRRGLALAPVLGVLMGEAAYGLLVVQATTGLAWWIVELAVGLAWLAVALVRARPDERGWLAGGTALAAATVYVGSTTLTIIMIALG